MLKAVTGGGADDRILLARSSWRAAAPELSERAPADRIDMVGDRGGDRGGEPPAAMGSSPPAPKVAAKALAAGAFGLGADLRKSETDSDRISPRAILIRSA